jgi:biopolymer transport protein ExbD
MRLPRNAKIFRGQLDAAPFAGVTFLLLLFLVLHTKLVFNPGIRIELPEVGSDLPGVAGPTVVVAVDRNGQVYYESQAVVSTADLRARLRAVVQRTKEPVILEVMADKAATYETTAPLLSLAGEVGMKGALLVTRPLIEPLKPTRR